MRTVDAVGGQEAASVKQSKVGDTAVSAILERLGAKLESGLTPEKRVGYSRLFKLVDRDGDMRHSKQEYIENGNYLTPESRRGIFNAADSDEDGFVTQAEYILNRVITDEGKAIVQAMDDDKDGQIQSVEFVKHATAKLGDANLAKDVFAALDANGNGEIVVPEYLRVWGQWARAGRMSPDKRITNNSPQVESESPQRDEGRRNGPPPGFGPLGRGVGPPSVAVVFERFDVNRDGTLEKDEVPEFARQFIFPADENSDQTITKQELKKFRESRGFGSRPGDQRSRRRGPPRGRSGNSRAFGPFSGNTDPVRLNRAGLKIGAELPKVVVFDAEGNEFPTANLKGSYSVLVFGCLT